MYVITIQRTNWIRWELTMRTEHAVSSTSQIPVWPHITPTTSALVWTSYSLNIFSQPCLPRPVYPLQVFGVLQPAKKCNLWPKSVICEHPSSITHSISLIEWHNENLDNCVRDACVLNKNKFSRWGGLWSFICGHNLQALGQYPGNRNCVYTPSQCNSQSVLFSCSLPPAWFDLISPAGVSFRPARAF